MKPIVDNSDMARLLVVELVVGGHLVGARMWQIRPLGASLVHGWGRVFGAEFSGDRGERFSITWREAPGGEDYAFEGRFSEIQFDGGQRVALFVDDSPAGLESCRENPSLNAPSLKVVLPRT